MALRFDVVTLFPELVEAVTQWGVVQRASVNGLIELKLWNPRDFTTDRHNTCLLYTSPSPRDLSTSRMPSSA